MTLCGLIPAVCMCLSSQNMYIIGADASDPKQAQCRGGVGLVFRMITTPEHLNEAFGDNATYSIST